uniref:Uncharacterized protein n=1 Tax=Anguilla anguilla TaxID=7936 RepID=A0A0E9Q7K4_ANGAN
MSFDTRSSDGFFLVDFTADTPREQESAVPLYYECIVCGKLASK